MLEQASEDALLEGRRAGHEAREVLQHEHPLVVHRDKLVLAFVELRYLYIYVSQLVVEHLVGVYLHELNLMVPAAGVLFTLGKVEVQEADGVDRVQVEVPVAATLCLLADGKRGIIYRAVLEELLVHVLHLHDELLATFVGAIHVEDGTASVGAVAEVLGVEVGDVAHRLLAVEQGVEETHEQLLIELGTEEPLETEIGMGVYVSFCHMWGDLPVWTPKVLI